MEHQWRALIPTVRMIEAAKAISGWDLLLFEVDLDRFITNAVIANERGPVIVLVE